MNARKEYAELFSAPTLAFTCQVLPILCIKKVRFYERDA
uniref:Uncharacterized protein n=1 Tax=Rhizophora mucronata TaxID=61149 RepID=A0A2P2QDV3_RHIMU